MPYGTMGLPGQSVLNWNSARGTRRRGRERARRHTAFIANPFGFTKQLLGQKWSGTLVCPVEEINQHLSDTYSDNRREEDLAPCRELITPPTPSTQFNTKEPTLAEVREAVRAKSTKSQSLQTSPETPREAVETHQGRMMEGEGSQAVATCRRCPDTKGGECEWHHAILYHLSTQCGRQNLLQDFCKPAHRVSPEEFLHWHHSAEGRSSRHARLSWAHRSGHPADPRGKGKPRRSVSHLASPCQRIWIHTTQACGNRSCNIPLSREDQGTHMWLLQQFQSEIHFLDNNIHVALPRERHHHWLHHISDVVRPGDKHACQGSRDRM